VWLVIEPQLIYHCFDTILPDAPQFATGWTSLKDSLGTPGGPMTYVSRLLSQGCYYAWLGAAIIVLAGFCLAELTRRHLAAAGFVRASVVATLPAIMFFLIHSHYKHPLTVCLAVSLGLFLSLIVERLPLRHPLVRVGLCCLFATVGFWLGGGGTLLVFALMIAIHGILGRLCTVRQQPSDPRQEGARCTPYYSDYPETVDKGGGRVAAASGVFGACRWCPGIDASHRQAGACRCHPPL